ncbi:mechanosensitive ion channel [Simiduia curdlanivorans]|uniref:Small-conductance mechanosensitive channel n=1 Tax=Simiduia curdlanivorans TaxID=1492769 RepID=A0ABV8V2G5_9GAMM|nr:mechanosensitive ion channel domain-containing protein [Simiduia curdlanivorans]MDN3637262.1 mechanosensitive ion channel [Simiduia curdlanivorans]
MRHIQIYTYALLVTALLFGYSPARAQSTSVEMLYQNTQNLSREIAQLQTEAKALAGERQASLQLRITGRQLELLTAFDTLTDRIVAEENDGVELTELKAKLAPQLLALGPQIKTAINRRLVALDKLEETHEALSITWMASYLEHNTFIDHAYLTLTQHAKNLADLKLDNAESTAYLHRALQQRAEVLAGQIALTQKELEANLHSLTASPDDAGTQQKVKSLEDKQNINTESLKSTVALLQENGLESGRYKEILINSTGDITADILDVNLLKRLSQTWLKNITNYVLDNGAGLFFKLIVFLLILLLFHYLSRTVAKLLRKSLAKSTMPVSFLMETMVVNLCRRMIMLIGILLGLSQLGFSLAPILAGLGVAGFIVGFALQDTLGNFASGMMILIYRPYDVDDLIEAAGVQGRVQRMNLVSTTILTIDNQTLVIPNNKIWGDVIRNVTAQKHRRVDMVFGIGYSDNIEKAEKILKDILDAHPQVLSEPEHTVKLHTLNESSVDFIVRPWVETENYWDVYWDVTKSVKLRFDAEGISIPFPQRDVHIYQTEKTA